jgi:hypothetical protein
MNAFYDYHSFYHSLSSCTIIHSDGGAAKVRKISTTSADMEPAALSARAEASSPEAGTDFPSSEHVPSFSDGDLEAILTTLGLGLSRSESLLAKLPKEIVGDIARHVRRLYDEDLEGRGLVTPVHLIRPEQSPQQLRAMIARGLAPTAPRPRRPQASRILVRAIRPSRPGFEGFDCTPSSSGFFSILGT